MSRKDLFTDTLIPPLLIATREAGRLIMSHYRQGRTVDRKADASPVTEADREADRLIVSALRTLTPSFPVVSEEGEKPDVGHAEHFWLVDPLDGTKSFIRGTGYFTVNIGLIENISVENCHSREGGNPGHDPRFRGGDKKETYETRGTPILGIIYDPANDVMYWGSGAGAFCKRGVAAPELIHTRKRQPEGGTAFISHTHINQATVDYLAAQGIDERIPCASSIKFCFLAEGNADLYPRFGPTMEWDTAAGHAILLGAGGSVTTPEGAPFVYGKQGFLNGNFVAGGNIS